MLRGYFCRALAVFALAAAADCTIARETSPDKLFGKFIGSSPNGPEVLKILSIPEVKDVDCTWSLELFEAADHAPTTYRLTCEYGKYSYTKPKAPQKREAVTKEGKWSFSKSTASAALRTIKLECGLKLLEVSKNVLHFLSAKDQLLVGNGGYSYSLCRAEAAEKPGAWDLGWAKPESQMTYRIGPLATGPGVYAVFEGRTPYKGIAAQLKLPWDEGCIKAKWRITLMQDEKTKAPAEYKIEGSLFKATPRTGQWRLEKGSEGAWSKIILEATKTQPEIVLLMGDENVLFLADESGQPRAGHGEFGYTMNRKPKSE